MKKAVLWRVLCGVGAALSAAFLITCGIHDTLLGLSWLGFLYTFKLLTGIDMFTISDTFLNNTFSLVVSGMVVLIPAAVFAGCLWFMFKPRLRWIALAASAALTALCSVLIYFQNWGITNFLIFSVPIALGAFGCILGLYLYEWLQKKLPQVFNRETVSYIIFGALTTVVSFVSQMLFSALGWHVTVNTVGSWICAVIFAYVVNKLFVFESKTDTAKAFFRELGLFVGARVASLGMELVFMFVTVDLLSFPESACKIVAQVFILIANYVLSKLLIFKKK